jgi:hypothetical protein
MKYFGVILFVLVGALFYLFHYAIVPLDAHHLWDALGYAVIQILWYLVGIAALYMVSKLCGLKWKQIGIGVALIVPFGLVVQLLHLPDKIDFWVAKKHLESVNDNYPNEKPQWVIVSSSYETLWPKRMPLVYDSRHYAFGTPAQIAKMKAQSEGRHFVQVDKAGWYILYEENIYGQGRP